MYVDPKSTFDSKGATRIETPESLARFFDNAATKKPWDRIGPALSFDQEGLLIQSGQITGPNNSKLTHEIGSQESIKENRKKDLREYTARAYLINGFSVSVQDIVDGLSRQSEQLSVLMSHGDEYFNRTPTRDDVLRVKDGKIISASQDPNDEYVVETAEEKAAFEEENEICVGRFAVDEIGYENGQAFIIPHAQEAQRIEASIAQIDEAKRQLEAGEITPDELPESMRYMIVPEPATTPVPQAPVLTGNLLPTFAPQTPMF